MPFRRRSAGKRLNEPRSLEELKRAYESEYARFDRLTSKAEALEARATKGMSRNRLDEFGAQLKLRGVPDKELMGRIKPSRNPLKRFFWKGVSALTRTEKRAGNLRKSASESINRAAKLEREYHFGQALDEHIHRTRILNNIRDFSALARVAEEEETTISVLQKLLKKGYSDGSIKPSTIEETLLNKKISDAEHRLKIVERKAKEFNPEYEEFGSKEINMRENTSLVNYYMNVATIGELTKFLRKENALIKGLDAQLASKEFLPKERTRLENLRKLAVKRKSHIVGKIALIRERTAPKEKKARMERLKKVVLLKQVKAQREAASGRKRAGLHRTAVRLGQEIEDLTLNHQVTIKGLNERIRGERNRLRTVQGEITASVNGQLPVLKGKATRAKKTMQALDIRKKQIREGKKRARKFIPKSVEKKFRREFAQTT